MKIFLGVAIFVVLSFAIATPLYVHLHSAKVTAGLVSSPHIDNNGGLEVHAVTPQQGLSVQSPAPASVPNPAPIPPKATTLVSRAPSNSNVNPAQTDITQTLIESEQKFQQQLAAEKQADDALSKKLCDDNNSLFQPIWTREYNDAAASQDAYELSHMPNNDPYWSNDWNVNRADENKRLSSNYTQMSKSINSVYGITCHISFPFLEIIN